jgi:uncharacterized protein
MKMKWCVTGFLLLVLCAGVELHAQQSDTNSIESIKTKAEKGNAIDELYLGTVYETGSGVAQDFAEAVKWYRKSADQGDAIAQLMLAQMYSDGRGVDKSASE